MSVERTTTSSLLNQQVFKRDDSGSSNKGGAVKKNVLTETRIALANRNKCTGKTCFTTLSNSINGRKEVIYVGGGSKSCGASKMTTMEKIAMWNQIMQSGMQFGQGIAGIVSQCKSSKAAAPVAPTKTTATGNETLATPTGNNKVAGNDLASTLDSLGFTDIDLTNIDYEQTAKDFTSKMDKAKNSQDLYQALQGAKAYKQQVSSRMAGMNIGTMEDDLKALKGDAEGSVSKAKEGVDTADKGVKDQEGKVKQGENQLESARKSYDNTRASLAKTNEKYNEASKNVDTKTKAYDTANKDLDKAKSDYSASQTATRECTQAWETAKLNTAQAEANLKALEAQLGSATDSVALQAQIADAKAQLETARQAEQAAEKAKTNAEENEAKMLENKNNKQTACDTAKSNLTEARNNLNTVAEQLKNDKQITEDQYKQLTDRQTSLDDAETNLETQKKTLTEKQEVQAKAQENLDKLNDKKEELEVRIHDYKEMQKASEKLNDLSKYETKLTQMMDKEKTTREELQKKLDEQNYKSNDITGTSAKGRAKAEKKEVKISGKIDNLNAGDATDDIARDNQLRSSHRADVTSQTNTHKMDPFAKMNDMAQQATQQQNEQALNNLKMGIPAEINGKSAMKMPGGDGDTYMVDGKSYTFDELQAAVKNGTI